MAHGLLTLTDTSHDVTDTGSFRYALNQVNAGSGGGTINFSSVTGTITLSSPLSTTQSVTINGPGANVLTISGNDTVQVFNVVTGITVNIAGLTIAHGFSTTGGGAIFSRATLTVDGCLFSDNAASSRASSVGGAINNGTSPLTAKNSAFASNKALAGTLSPLGDAIFSTGAIEVDNSTFLGRRCDIQGERKGRDYRVRIHCAFIQNGSISTGESVDT